MTSGADWPARDPRLAPNGYVYLVEFTGGVVKIGRTDSPRVRLRQHRWDAGRFGLQVVRAWLSVPHQAWIENEQALIEQALCIGTPLAGREYVRADFDQLMAAAQRLDVTPAPSTFVEPLRPPAGDLLTAREAARVAGVSIKTLDRYQAAGLITPQYMPGGHRRFRRADVDSL